MASDGGGSRSKSAERTVVTANDANLVDGLPMTSSTRSEQLSTTSEQGHARAAPSAIPQKLVSQSRNRGYSLRRSLFAQNIQKQNDDHGTVLELTPTTSNSTNVPTTASKEKNPITSIIEKPDYASASAADRRDVYLDMPDEANASRKRSRTSHGNLKSKITHLRDRLFGPTVLKPTVDGRHVHICIGSSSSSIDERTGKPYISNKIRSCKYTLWNFLPKQLVAQFGKLANFYFLVISILQMIPGLSTTGTFTTIVPLLIFVSISMAKEGYEDIRRNRLDKEDNERITLVLSETALQNKSNTTDGFDSSSPAWKKVKWEEVKVGDVILLERDTPVPADVIMLHANGVDGAAFIETMSLDGETNLKNRKPIDLVSQRCTSSAAVTHLQADFVVEDPNLDLYKFDGRVTLAGETLPLTSNEVIYRGSIIRNTSIAVGLVVYSGEECKIRMNANKNPRVKAPTLQARVNRVVIMVAGLVMFIAVILTIGYVIWKRTFEKNAWYLDGAAVPYGHVFTSFVIMLNTMLPLSLYVSLEIVKVAQMFQMNDIDMYHAESNTPMEPKTSTLNEELGQINYLFSDKTGTLTDNSMKFRKLSIAGSAFLHDYDLLDDQGAGVRTKLRHKKRHTGGKKEKGKHKRGDSKSLLVQSTTPTGPQSAPNLFLSHTSRTADLLEYLFARPQSLFARKARFFLLAIALCHTCTPEKSDDGEITYQAASPDETALVKGAQDLGLIVCDRQSNSITVKTQIPGDDESTSESYQILDVIEFSSYRKRMSIILRLPDGRICLFSKGADTTIRNLLRQSEVANMYAEDVRRVSDARKSLDTQAAMQRRSSQLGRTSLSSPIGRQSSVSLGRRQSMRQSVDIWLREREAGSTNQPRISTHHVSRQSESIAPNTVMSARTSSDSGRTSMQSEVLDNMIDEATVINDNTIFQKCFSHIDDFASEGLRTLLYGHRFIPEEEYKKWKLIQHAAATSVLDRQRKLEDAAEIIERGLELTGATAIEDKLQDGVPDAIERFRRAGIKVWMLTGDKKETAINIGHSCRLIRDISHVMILDYENGNLASSIANFVQEIASGAYAHCVLVIDGQTLTTIEAHRSMNEAFTDLAVRVDSVVCCRASPSQKAELIKRIRTKVKGSVTLAIGDGANDIPMIREAHIGIGIAGKEGLQAARTADYSIAQFRYLLKLLLVHGRWNYTRVCKYTLGTFWKEMLFYLVQASYQRWNGFTGTSLFEPWSLSMFNTLFTSLPVIFMGVFEKDLAPATLLAVPELYSYGQQNQGFTIPLYLWWAFLGAVESQIVYFIMYGIYGEALFTRDQQLFAVGALAFTACVTLISLKLQFFELHNKNIMAGIAIFLSVGGWWLWNLILSKVYNPDNRLYNVNGGLVSSFGKNVLWWLTLFLIVLAVSILEFVIKTVKTVWFPNDVELFQVLERDLDVKMRFEESAAELLQAGWNRGTKKSSLEVAHEENEQANREAEVQDILDRPRTMDTQVAEPVMGIRKRQSWQPTDLEVITTNQETPPPVRKSVDIGELFSKGFGKVRQDSMK